MRWFALMMNTTRSRSNGFGRTSCSSTSLFSLSHSLLMRTQPLWILPRASITQLTAPITIACPTKLPRQVFCGDLLEQSWLIIRTEDRNLGNSDRIKPTFNSTPNGRESPRRVDKVEFSWLLKSNALNCHTHCFGIIVLANFGGFLEISVYLSSSTKSNTL